MPPSTHRVIGGGSILFADGDVLMSRPFDPRGFSSRVRLGRSPISSESSTNRPQVSSASDGTLVYQVRRTSSRNAYLARPQRKIPRCSLSSTPASHICAFLGTIVTPLTYRVDPRVGSGDIWILDLQRGTETRFTSHPAYEWMPVWSPDATRIAFGSNRNGTMDLYVKPVSGSEDERLVFASANRKVPTDWSPDGRLLVFQQESAGKQIWALRPPSRCGTKAVHPC